MGARRRRGGKLGMTLAFLSQANNLIDLENILSHNRFTLPFAFAFAQE